MTLRSSDDLNLLICARLAETGSLTSDELFTLAKPYYELTDCKSELSQWARARIANLRKKRKVWPTAHMVYGTSKGKAASTDFEGLKNQIPPDEFYEAPRTVYWSWDFGLAKHDIDRARQKELSMPVTPDSDHKDREGEGENGRYPMEADEIPPYPGTDGDGYDGEAEAEVQYYPEPPAHGWGSGGGGGGGAAGSPFRGYRSAADEATAAAGAAAAVAAVATTPTLPRRTFSESSDGGVQFAHAGRGDPLDDMVSPTRDIRGSLTATHISSPKRGASFEPFGMSPAKRRTPSRTSVSDSPNGGGGGHGVHGSPLPQMNPYDDGDPEEDDGEDVWEDEHGSRGSHSPQHSSADGANKLLLLAAAAQLGLPDESSPEQERERERTSARPSRKASPSSKVKAARAAAAAAAAGSPRRSAAQHRGSKYKCGKCGFFPKSTPHNCSTRTARGGSKGVASNAASPERAKSASPRKAVESPRYQSRPKQYACGKCGFFPKSTAHSCKTATAVDPALASSPRRKNYRRNPNPSVASGEGRPRQYRCGRCGFFPKAMRHDCETGKAYATSSPKSPAAAARALKARKGSPRRPNSGGSGGGGGGGGGAGGVDLNIRMDVLADSFSQIAAASILMGATPTSPMANPTSPSVGRSKKSPK